MSDTPASRIDRMPRDIDEWVAATYLDGGADYVCPLQSSPYTQTFQRLDWTLARSLPSTFTPLLPIRTTMRQRLTRPLLIALQSLTAVCWALSSQADIRTDILILGDSQISFSAGTPYLEFFGNLKKYCPAETRGSSALAKLKTARVSAIGVRSSSLNAWTAQSGAAKSTICAVDKKWGVNAGVFGINGDPERRFVQIGQGREFQFCRKGTSPLQGALRSGYYDPKVVVFSLLGNGAQRWASSPNAARDDAAKMLGQLPEGVGCLFLSTAPVYSKKVNDLRARAQTNLRAAFAQTGNQCAFVSGFSEETRAIIEGNARFFARHANGRVKDGLHPNEAAIHALLDRKTPEICAAIAEVLE